MVTIRSGPALMELPHVRHGDSFSLPLFSKLAASDQSFVMTMVEGARTQRATSMVCSIVDEVCGPDIPIAQLSSERARLEQTIRLWHERPLHGRSYPFLVAGAFAVSVHDGGKARSRQALMITGVNGDGFREVLGLTVTRAEQNEGWSSLFAGLKARGLGGVDVMVADDRPGLAEALAAHLPGSVRQMSHRHLIERVTAAAPKHLRPEMTAQAREMLGAGDADAAVNELLRFRRRYGEGAPESVGIMDRCADTAFAVLALPARYRSHFRSAHLIERLEDAILQRARVIRTFPTESDAWFVGAAVAMEFDRDWSNGHRYLNLADYNAWKARRSSASVAGS